MEAPEKIYLVNDDLNIKQDWYKTKQVGFETTEYTRTDTVIGKAVDYIAENMKCDGYTFQAKAKFIRDFKNYIKGE